LLQGHLFVPNAMEQPTSSTNLACQEIANNLPPGRVYFPRDSNYKSEVKQYWSKCVRDLRPACVVLPTTVAEISAVIRVLNRYLDVNIAVKSGGHDPNPGHASTDGGVLIAMRRMSGAKYDKASGCAYIKPGGTWNDVIRDLEPQGVTVVGGRLGNVGVGGYLLQGGLSFLSAQYGLAVDSIVGWEAVMPDGSVVNVDAATKPDIAVAMRGSGSQFGIVTQFKMKAHPIGRVWGGFRLYSKTQRNVLFSTLHNFIVSGVKDPKAAIICSEILMIGGLAVILVHYFYDGAKPPTTGPFADFLKIPSFGSFTKRQKYSELLKFNAWVPGVVSGRASFRTFTIPYVASNPDIYNEISSKWCRITSSYLGNFRHATSRCVLVFQPFPSIIGQHSQNAGGNAMGLSGSDPDRLIIELHCMWSNRDDDGMLRGMSREMTDWLQSKMPEWLAQAGGVEYMPYFMNDAMSDQNVGRSYRDYEKFRALQMQIDPNGMFRKRLGGFKY
ncbi:hypothetical protein GQ44DRAFT_635186, partial [Phaeosphaeriaceae sp. PMI808]